MAPSRDDQLRQEIATQRALLNKLRAIEPTYQELRAGKGDELLAQMQAAGEKIVAAEKKLQAATRVPVERFNPDAWKRERMDAWANDPTPMRQRDPYEPVAKAFWLLRSGLPSPLQDEEMDGARLTPEEGQEFYDLTLRARKGEMTASEAPRWEELLEKMADRPTGSIAAARQYEAERRVQDAEQAAAEREAQRSREAERERRFIAMCVPRL